MRTIQQSFDWPSFISFVFLGQSYCWIVIPPLLFFVKELSYKGGTHPEIFFNLASVSLLLCNIGQVKISDAAASNILYFWPNIISSLSFYRGPEMNVGMRSALSQVLIS
jgi:hypothetical protein